MLCFAPPPAAAAAAVDGGFLLSLAASMNVVTLNLNQHYISLVLVTVESYAVITLPSDFRGLPVLCY